MRKWFHYKLYIRTNFSILFLFPSENFLFSYAHPCVDVNHEPQKSIVWKIEVIRQVFYVIVAQKFLLVVKGKQIFSPSERCYGTARQSHQSAMMVVKLRYDVLCRRVNFVATCFGVEFYSLLHTYVHKLNLNFSQCK